MKKFYVDQDVLLGLYTYLRQMELSIDRVLYDSWESFVWYVHEKISPQHVITYLESLSMGSVDVSAQPINSIMNIRLFDKMTALFLKMVGVKPYLSSVELLHIYSALHTVITLLETVQAPEQERLIQLRMKLNACCERIALKLSRQDVRNAQNIEHFNQNEVLSCVSLEEIVGGRWLK